MSIYTKLSGFFILTALMVAVPQFTVHSEEVSFEVPVEQAEFSAPAEELQSRMPASEPNGMIERSISSENPIDKTQVLEINKKIVEKEPKQSRKELFYKCEKGREVRWMRLYYMKNGRCRTEYSKSGDAKEVSTAYTYDTCEEVLNNIKKNLETGGYACTEKILMGALELN